MTENLDLSEARMATRILSIIQLNGKFIDSGFYVFFKLFQNDRNDYNARNIMVIEAAERRRKHGNTRK